ncbi:hypothetical protein LXL04_021391 [Taraxacum kok-saghyz]
MEDHRLRFKLLSSSAVSNNTDGAVDSIPLLKTKIFARSSRWSLGRFTGSVLFGINSALGYFLMLAIMLFNAGAFVAIVFGLATRYLSTFDLDFLSLLIDLIKTRNWVLYSAFDRLETKT